MIYVLSFIVAFIYVGLKAWQQINVIKGRFLQVPFPSMGMALCEVSIISLVVKDSLWLAIPIGLGGCFGCWLAMWANK
jgi:hypothetical protein